MARLMQFGREVEGCQFIVYSYHFALFALFVMSKGR